MDDAEADVGRRSSGDEAFRSQRGRQRMRREGEDDGYDDDDTEWRRRRSRQGGGGGNRNSVSGFLDEGEYEY